jgi:hypothetical protein
MTAVAEDAFIREGGCASDLPPSCLMTPPLSIVCVYNSTPVRENCLDRSIEAAASDGFKVEYIPVDNRNRAFATAGAALNHGASVASGDHLAFIQQDIYLHAPQALLGAASILATHPRLGMLGACGMPARGPMVGRVRDRFALVGRSAPRLVLVSSLDEVLFIVPRWVWERFPITDLPDLAWHGYAVEYAVRIARAGLRTAAIDIPMTHNSLRRDDVTGVPEAHAAISRMYPEIASLRTTTGTIRRRTLPGARLRAHWRWRLKRAGENAAVIAAARACGQPRHVVGDVRVLGDDFLEADVDGGLLVVNLDSHWPTGHDGRSRMLELRRGERHVTVVAARPYDLADLCSGAGREFTSHLVTNLRPRDLRRAIDLLPAGGRLLGYHASVGLWLLGGAAAGHTAPAAAGDTAPPHDGTVATPMVRTGARQSG